MTFVIVVANGYVLLTLIGAHVENRNFFLEKSGQKISQMSSANVYLTICNKSNVHTQCAYVYNSLVYLICYLNISDCNMLRRCVDKVITVSLA